MIQPNGSFPSTPASKLGYSMQFEDRTVAVPQDHWETAAALDSDKNHLVSSEEVRQFVAGHRDEPISADVLTDQANEFRSSLAGLPNPYAKGYRDFNTLIRDFDRLAESQPKYVHKEVLGKTAEGRDIAAYRFSSAPSGSKPGVVITGCHHAREWMTVEAPLALGQSLLEGIDGDPARQKRLSEGEIWIVPCVNPDGYEYSRNKDNMWRKNRSPQETDQLGKPTGAVGVDLNRNYGDETLNHHQIFRPDSDKPGTTSDDFGATSDDPFSETYRGKAAASEPEVKAMQALELRPNIRGTVDFHSYGDDLLYPWSHSAAKPAEEAFYTKLGGDICQATGYRLESGISLYPNSGSSDIFQEANGIRTFTVEMGQSFQPNPKKIPEITGKAAAAATLFADGIIAAANDGSLGPRQAQELPPPQGSRGPAAPEVRSDSSPEQRYFGPH